MSKKKPNEKTEKELLEEIKWLLTLIATKLGATNSETAKALNCGESTLRKRVSFIKKKND